MLIELALTHPCGEIIHWSAGTYHSPRSRPESRRRPRIHQCPRCRESLGTPFVRAEDLSPGDGPLQLQAS